MKKRDTSRLSVFELTEEEVHERLQPIADKLTKDLYAKSLPVVFQDDLCPTDYHFIRRYEDGRRFLVLFDVPSGKYKVLKQLA